jgi:hypothetical protein
VRSLHDVKKINAYKAEMYVCPSVRMVELEKRWTDFDEIWCGLYAVGNCPKLQSIIPTWRTNELVRWDRN